MSDNSDPDFALISVLVKARINSQQLTSRLECPLLPPDLHLPPGRPLELRVDRPRVVHPEDERPLAPAAAGAALEAEATAVEGAETPIRKEKVWYSSLRAVTV